MNYQKLTSEHDEIDVLAGALEALLSEEAPASGAVAAARDRLAVVLKDHLQHEDHFLYSKLIRSHDRGTAEKARAFAQEFKELRVDWDRYLAEWPDEAIAEDEGAFRAETLSILRRMQERVREETSLLYPLALQKGAIRLRSARPVPESVKNQE